MAKKSSGKKSASKKAKGGKKSGTKKNLSSKKVTSKKATAKKGGAKRGGARKAAVAAAAEELCFEIEIAGAIVASCLQHGVSSWDDTLQEAGEITPDQRERFRTCVFNSVLEFQGCSIDATDIPNGADSVLSDIRSAVRDNAHK